MLIIVVFIYLFSYLTLCVSVSVGSKGEHQFPSLEISTNPSSETRDVTPETKFKVNPGQQGNVNQLIALQKLLTSRSNQY